MYTCIWVSNMIILYDNHGNPYLSFSDTGYSKVKVSFHEIYTGLVYDERYLCDEDIEKVRNWFNNECRSVSRPS